MTGKICWTADNRQFAFIDTGDGEQQVFLHVSEAERAGLELNRGLLGTVVEFDLVTRTPGPRAVNVRPAA